MQTNIATDNREKSSNDRLEKTGVFQTAGDKKLQRVFWHGSSQETEVMQAIHSYARHCRS
jgi:hypothetical protein